LDAGQAFGQQQEQQRVDDGPRNARMSFLSARCRPTHGRSLAPALLHALLLLHLLLLLL